MKEKICGLCPRKCVKAGENKGFCGVDNDAAQIAHVMLHHFEEPFISGTKGSGTVFFGGCSLSCVYCQNHAISRANYFPEYDFLKLADVFLFLQEKGAHNINLVTPTHYSGAIKKAVKKAKEYGLKLPVIYNTSGYEKREVIKALKGTVDVFLTDFKYHDNAYAEKYSSCENYFEYADAALRQMVLNTGSPRFDENGLILSGTVVRHLTLPGLLTDSKRVLAHLYENFGNSVIISIMNQFTPTSGLDKNAYPELNRPVPKKQYDELIDFALSLGIKNALIQEGGTCSESFIPAFNN